MDDFDPAAFMAHLEHQQRDPAVTAAIDQLHAKLDELNDRAMWWVTLMALCDLRGDSTALAMASFHAKRVLEECEIVDLVTLNINMMWNFLHLYAATHENGDMAALVSQMVGGERMLNFEKFAATRGASCPSCGDDEGWNEHPCGRLGDDESFLDGSGRP